MWDDLVSRLTRPDPSSGITIGGEYELRGILGSNVHSVSDLASAKALSQKALTEACFRAVVFCPWVAPGPRQHAYLLFGFSLARANARMLINADSKRRSARNSVRTSRPQSASAATVHG